MQLETSLASFTAVRLHKLQLTVPARQFAGAEIASDAGWTFDGGKTWPYGHQGYGYGYYEARLKTANVGDSTSNTGVVNSFFLKGAPCCGTVQEIDFEFLTNESWLRTSAGAVHCTISWPGGSISQKVSLPFTPSLGGHTYGLLWTPDGTVKFYADDALVETLHDAGMVSPENGMIIMANAWTGNPNWGGLPPAQDAVATYGHIAYWPNRTSPPVRASAALFASAKVPADDPADAASGRREAP